MQDQPGFMERALLSVASNLTTDLSPAELYRLAQALTGIDPSTMPTCVLDGSYGSVNGASIIFPDVAQARRLGNEAAQRRPLRPTLLSRGARVSRARAAPDAGARLGVAEADLGDAGGALGAR